MEGVRFRAPGFSLFAVNDTWSREGRPVRERLGVGLPKSGAVGHNEQPFNRVAGA